LSAIRPIHIRYKIYRPINPLSFQVQWRRLCHTTCSLHFTTSAIV